MDDMVWFGGDPSKVKLQEITGRDGASILTYFQVLTGGRVQVCVSVKPVHRDPAFSDSWSLVLSAEDVRKLMIALDVKP